MMSYTQDSLSTNKTVDHCRAPSSVTYGILSWVMVVEFVLGLPLNLSVLYIFIFRFKFWKNKSIFLFNIVVADFLLVACLPIKIYDYQHQQRHNPSNWVCKTLHFMLFLNRGASIFFLIALSLDRYFNVVHLGRRNCVSVLKKSPLISVVIWLFLLPLTIPTMVTTFECCNSHGRVVETPSHDITDTFREVVFFSQILIPFFILLFCTVRTVKRLRRKTVGDKARLRRVVFIISSVVIVFSICFLPCAVARAVLLIVRLNEWPAAENVAAQVHDSLMVLSFTDSLLDPLVYCFFHSGFKTAYVSVFCPPFLKDSLLNKITTVPTTTTVTTNTTSAVKPISLQKIEEHVKFTQVQ